MWWLLRDDGSNVLAAAAMGAGCATVQWSEEGFIEPVHHYWCVVPPLACNLLFDYDWPAVTLRWCMELNGVTVAPMLPVFLFTIMHFTYGERNNPLIRLQTLT